MQTRETTSIDAKHGASSPLASHTDDLVSEAVGETDGVFLFRGFKLYPGTRQLLCEGLPIELGSRAFDLLVVLLRSRGALVTKDEIIKHVWPSTVVEESNLRFQMAYLRKMLGDDRDVIKTIPGRGYQFIAEVALERLDRSSVTGASLHSAIAEPLPQKTEHISVGDSLNRDPVVAIIDDDADTREAIHGLLRSAGLKVESFPSVQAFLNRKWPSGPDCLVLDVLLPGQNGLDFQTELARANILPPVIFISGYADVHMSVRAMKAGASDFLTKPVRHHELLEAIRKAIEAGPIKKSSASEEIK